MEKFEKLEEIFNYLENLPEEEKEMKKKSFEIAFFGAINSIPEKDLAPIKDKEIMNFIDLFSRIVKGKAYLKDLVIAVYLLSLSRQDLLDIATICRKILPSLL